MSNAEAVHVVDRGAQADRAGDVRRAGFEFVRQLVVSCLLECDGTDHVAAALIRRHGVEQRRFAVQHADAGRPVNLVAGEGVEIAVERLHVHLHVRHGLRAIHQHGNVVAVRQFDHSLERIDRAERIRDVRDGDQLRSRPEQFRKFVEQQLAVVVDRSDAKLGALFVAQNLPRHDVGVMLHCGDQHFVAGLNVGAAKGLRDQIDAFGGAADENDFVRVRQR